MKNTLEPRKRDCDAQDICCELVGINCPSQACVKVLHVFVSFLTLFTSFYMMHVNFYMPEILTAAGNSYKVFLYSIQNLNAEDIFHFLQNFPSAFPIVTSNQTSVIVIIYSFDKFSILPLKGFICNKFLSVKK